MKTPKTYDELAEHNKQVKKPWKCKLFGHAWRLVWYHVRLESEQHSDLCVIQACLRCMSIRVIGVAHRTEKQ